MRGSCIIYVHTYVCTHVSVCVVLFVDNRLSSFFYTFFHSLVLLTLFDDVSAMSRGRNPFCLFPFRFSWLMSSRIQSFRDGEFVPTTRDETTQRRGSISSKSENAEQNRAFKCRIEWSLIRTRIVTKIMVLCYDSALSYPCTTARK